MEKHKNCTLCIHNSIYVDDKGNKLGYNHGVETVFVETGVHKREDIEKSEVRPNHIVKDLTEIDLSQFGWNF